MLRQIIHLVASADARDLQIMPPPSPHPQPPPPSPPLPTAVASGKIYLESGEEGDGLGQEGGGCRDQGGGGEGNVASTCAAADDLWSVFD